MQKAAFPIALVSALVLVAGQQPRVAPAAVDAYLKLDGVSGESKDDRHRDWIEISSFALSVHGAQGASGAGAGKVKHSPLSVHKVLDVSSPDLPAPTSTPAIPHVTCNDIAASFALADGSVVPGRYAPD